MLISDAIATAGYLSPHTPGKTIVPVVLAALTLTAYPSSNGVDEPTARTSSCDAGTAHHPAHARSHHRTRARARYYPTAHRHDSRHVPPHDIMDRNLFLSFLMNDTCSSITYFLLWFVALALHLPPLYTAAFTKRVARCLTGNLMTLAGGGDDKTITADWCAA